MAEQTDLVKVIHAGDKTQGIEATGETRMMGRAQFDLFGKKKGWKLAPKTSKLAGNTGTPNDPEGSAGSAGTGDGGSNDGGSENLNELNAKDLIAKIKELAEAGDKETIQTIKTTEEAMEEPRITVIGAADKFLTNEGE